MKIRDRDLKKIRLDPYLNEFLWGRGIRYPPHKVKVKAMKKGEIIVAELVDFPKKLAARKSRAEKLEQFSKETAAKKKKEEVKPAEEKKIDETSAEEKKIEEKEKKASTIEAGKEMEKMAAKQMKHTVKGSDKAPIIQRTALDRH